MSEHIFSTRPTDRWPVEQRATLLAETILPAVWAASGNIFTRDYFCRAGMVLDISCGRGALALASRQLSSTSKYVGIDTYDYQNDRETPTAYREYDSVRVETVRSNATLSWLERWSFNLAIAICTHPDVYGYVVENVDAFPINVGGKVVFISEVSLDGCEERGFWRGVGEEYGYQIAVYQKEQ